MLLIFCVANETKIGEEDWEVGGLFEKHSSIGRLLKRIERMKGIAGDKALAPLGLSMSLWFVLRLISKYDDMSANAMAEASHVTAQSFGEIIQKLLGRDLIRKRASRGRANFYELTELGSSLLCESEGRMQEVFGRIFSPLSEAETDLLENLLQKVVDDNE